MKGKILDYNEQTGEGLILCDKGDRYIFTIEDIKSDIKVSKGMEADFIAQEERAKDIYLTENIASFYNPINVPFYEDQQKGFWELFSAQGCYTRKQYWMVFLAGIVIWAIFYVLLMIVAKGGRHHMNGIGSIIFVAYIAGVVLPFIYINIVTSIKRFHDINKSGWFYLLSLIPYVGGLIVLVMNGFMPTVKENNIYCRRRENVVYS